MSTGRLLDFDRQPIRQPKASEVIADELRRVVVCDGKPGDYLMAERLLIERFGVSRPTLREALRILEGKLAAIEQDHEMELEAHQGGREEADAKAEARALTAILDFLQACKIAPGESLLRLFRRYLRASKDRTPIREHRAAPRSRAPRTASRSTPVTTITSCSISSRRSR